jgi:predicted ATPase
LTTHAVSSDITKLAINVRETGETVQKLQLNHHEQQMMDWLSAPDPSTNYMNALKKRHEGTGAWFTGGRAFDDWKKQPNSFLWLHGLAGCGKTILSSTIIEHLSNVATPDQTLLYFYFDFNDKNKQTLEKMLRSLAIQLYQAQPDDRGPLEQLWGKGQNQPSQESLSDVLLAMLSRLNNVSIVLDALDESTTGCSKS